MRILGVALLTLLSFSASAESAWRAGVGVGRADAQEDDVGFDASSTSWEIFGGWEMNQYLAFEAGYIYGGKPKDDIAGATVEMETHAIQASVLGSLWVNDAFGVFGRLGMLSWKADAEGRVNGQVLARSSDDGTDAFYGVGIATVLDGALLRAEYRIADFGDIDYSQYSINVAWRF